MPLRAVAALCLAFVLPSCGGDEPSAPSASATPADDAAAADRYRAGADAVCVRLARDVRGIGERLGIPQTFPDQAPYEEANAAVLAEQTTRLRALTVPPALRARHEAFVAAADGYATAYATTAERARAADQPGWQRAVRAHQLQGNELLATARALELQACARRPSPPVAATVRETVERLLLGRDPAVSCAQDVTPGFLRSNLSGSRNSCRKILEGLARDGASLSFSTTIGVGGITGVDGVIASANVRFRTARDAPVRRVIYDLSHDGMRWRVDSAFDQGVITGDGGSAQDA